MFFKVINLPIFSLIFTNLSFGKMYNDSLLELIETFTPSEKNSFKRYINFTGGGRLLKYEKLYNIYNKHLNQNYDKATFDKKVKAALKKDQQLSKDLNNIRKRLKDKLLESLVIQNNANSNNVAITKGINEARILNERKLHNAALHKIKLLKDKAKTYNLNKHLLELIEMEISIVAKSSNKNDDIDLQLLFLLQEKHLHLYTVEMSLRNIFYKINIIIEKDLYLGKKKHLTYLQELHDKLDAIPIEEHLKNKQVKIILWYYRIKSLYFRVTNKIDIAFMIGKKLLDFFESDKILLKNFQPEYVKVICSFSRICHHLNKNAELNSILNRVKNIYENQKNYDALEATCEMGVLHYLNTFQYEKADEIASLMDKNWLHFKRKTMDGKLLWYTHTNSVLYWFLGNQKKLELWADRGLDIKRPNKGKVFLFGIRMLMLTLDYDEKKLLHFNAKVQALHKTMNNNEDLKAFEKLVLKYLKKLASIEMSTQSKIEKATLSNALFKEFKEALLNLQQGKANFVEPINYEEILLWCESHLQKKSVKDIYEAQFEQVEAV